MCMKAKPAESNSGHFDTRAYQAETLARMIGLAAEAGNVNGGGVRSACEVLADYLLRLGEDLEQAASADAVPADGKREHSVPELNVSTAAVRR